MKTILFALLLGLCAGCVTQVERPYVKETVTSRDGTITVRESSADRITGASLDSFKKLK